MYDGMERPVYDERDPRLPMSAEDVVALLGLDGGDRCLARRRLGRRRAARRADARARRPRPRRALARTCRCSSRRSARRATRSRRGSCRRASCCSTRLGRQVDVHPVAFDESGDGIYGMEEGGTGRIRRAGFTGEGSVLGRTVPLPDARGAGALPRRVRAGRDGPPRPRLAPRALRGQYGNVSDASGVAREVDERLDGEERADDDDRAADDRGRQRELARRLTSRRRGQRQRGPHVHRADDREVVVEAERGGDHADDDEPGPAAVPRGGEGVELRRRSRP